MKAVLYELDGEMLSVPQMQKRMPVLSLAMIRHRIALGMTTSLAMLAYDTRAANAAAGRRGRAACGKKLWTSNKATA